MVMISNYTRFDRLIGYLRHYTRNWIALPMGVPTLREIFNDKYYAELEGGILEGLGRLFHGVVKLNIYPEKRAEQQFGTAEMLEVAPRLRHVYAHLLENGFIEPIRAFHGEQLHIFPSYVVSRIQSGGADWESMVPPPVAAQIKKAKLFGYRGAADGKAGL